MSERPSAAEVVAMLRAQAKKNKKPYVISLASEFHNPFDLRRPSGLISLDLATGGGLPAGGLCEIAGPEGVGKNYLANRYISRVQEIYGDDVGIAVICFEASYDKSYARRCGVHVAYDDYEIERLRQERVSKGKELSDEEIAQLKKQVGQFVIIRDDPESALDMTIDIIASNAFQIVLLDSWDALLVEDARDKSFEESERVGSMSTLQTRFARKLFHALNSSSTKGYGENETTIIALRQVRANMSAMPYQRKWKVGGAQALKHTNLVQIVLSPGSRIKDGSTYIGKEVNWEIGKGKAGCHDGPRGTFRYYYDPPHIDEVEDFLQAMYKAGIIRKKRGKEIYDVKDGQDVIFSGTIEELTKEIESGGDIRQMVESLLLDIHGIENVRYR